MADASLAAALMTLIVSLRAKQAEPQLRFRGLTGLLTPSTSPTSCPLAEARPATSAVSRILTSLCVDLDPKRTTFSSSVSS